MASQRTPKAKPAGPGRHPRQLGEDSFRRLFEWAPNAMVMVDEGGRVVLINAQAELVFGYGRDELIGQPVEVLVPNRYAQRHPPYRNGYFADPRPRPMGSGRDLFARRRDGSEFPVEIGLNPIETGEGPMVLASVVDITERRRAQQAIEAALQEKTVLLNEVHHRVKNNLQMISSLLELQAANADDSRLREALNESRHRVKAMAMTHQLLYERKDFSHLDLGEYLERLGQSLLSGYSTGGTGGGVRLRLELPSDKCTLELERAVPCALMVSELVTNAFKHAFPGGRRGEILIALAVAGEEIRLTVADDGVGLPAGFSLDAVKSLGLQLVPLLADQMHGTVTIAGGPGTRVTLRFPARLPARRSK